MAAGSIEAGILGPLQAAADGRPLVLAGERQRACLALLLLARGGVVPREALAEELWGRARPASERASVQMHMSRLRQALQQDRIAGTPVASINGGYALTLEVALDADHFEEAVARARELAQRGDRAAAAAAFADALALWRGQRPLADAGDGPLVAAERRRLEDLRRSAQLERAELVLDLGHPARVLTELQALGDEHPFDERVTHALVRALAGSGRHADALAAFQAARRRMVDELGLEPGPELHQLNAALLRREVAAPATVELDAGSVAAPAAHGHPPKRPWSRVARGTALIAALVAALATAALVAVGDDDDAVRLPATGAVAVLDAPDGGVDAVVAAGPRPVGVAALNGDGWIATAGDANLVRVRSYELQPLERVQLPGGLDAVVGAFGAIWAVDGAAGVVRRVDPQTGRTVTSTRIGNGPVAVSAGAGAVWVLDAVDATLTRLAPDGRRTGRVAVGSAPSAVLATSSAVWVADEAAGTVSAVHPKTLAPAASVSVGQRPRALAVADASLWSANALDGTVSRIDPARARVVATIPVGRGVGALTAGAGGLWVADPAHAGLALIDPEREAVTRRVRLGAPVTALAAIGRKIWAATASPAASHRGGTLVLAGFHRPATRFAGDPAADYSGDADAIHAITNDGLLTYRRATGAPGAQIVPDLAAALPTRTGGGTTWTFRLQRGIRFSTGARVRPSDVRATLLRVYRMHPPALDDYLPMGLVGEAACLRRPATCAQTLGVQADDAAGTVTMRLTTDGRSLQRALAAPLFSVVPADTPAHPLSHAPFPATGPYRVVTREPGLVVLERNAMFRPWSSDAQPPGYADRIVWRNRLSLERARAAVRAGRADVLLSEVDSETADELARGLATRIVTVPFPSVEFFSLDTTTGPFADARVRRAAALAADRAQLARAVGGPLTRPLLCHMLPAGFPGSRPGCPRADGGALLRARALVAAAGMRGRRVELLEPTGRPGPARATKLFAATLRRIGLRPRTVPGPTGERYFHALLTRRRPDAAWAHWWTALIPDPDQILPPLLGCTPRPAAFNISRWCDRKLDRLVARANALTATDAAAAAQLWARADRRATAAAALIPFAGGRLVQALAPRVGGVTTHPRYGLLLSQLWVR